jgi:hypothetical protein
MQAQEGLVASAMDPKLWRVAGMNHVSGLDRELRELLARDYLDRLRSEVSTMKVQPRLETVAWAVDELNEIAWCVGEPGTPQARLEMDSALAEVVEKLREVAWLSP